MPPVQAAPPDLQSRRIARGATINTIGAVLRGIFVPLQMAVFGRLFGAHALGLFLWCYSCIEITVALSTSGFADAAIVFGARHTSEADDGFRCQARSLLRITALLSFSLALVLVLAAASLERATSQEGLALTLRLLAPVIPLTALTRMLVSIPKARQVMGNDVWAQALTLPVVAIVLAWPLSRAFAGNVAIAATYTIAYGAAFAVAVLLVRRLMALSALFRGGGVPREEVLQVIGFAFPQNANMGLNQLIANTDVLLLGALGASPSEVALYGIGAQIIGNIRQTRTVVADSLAPVLARNLHLGNTAPVNEHIRKASDWVMSLAVPAIALVAAFPQELVRAFSPEFSGPVTFMYALLVYPAFNCALGLMGNALIMSGNSKVNLCNSLAVGAINLVLNLLWIPRYGLIGAALATSVATATIAVVQVWEAKVIVGVHVPWARLTTWVALGFAAFGWPFLFGAARWALNARVFAFAPTVACWLLVVYGLRRRTAAARN